MSKEYYIYDYVAERIVMVTLLGVVKVENKQFEQYASRDGLTYSTYDFVVHDTFQQAVASGVYQVILQIGNLQTDITLKLREIEKLNTVSENDV